MKVNLNGSTYFIKFFHNGDGQRPVPTNIVEFADACGIPIRQGHNKFRRFTSCYLTSTESDEGILTFSFACPRDVFSRKLGRRISLGRALKAYGFPRQERDRLIEEVEQELISSSSS